MSFVKTALAAVLCSGALLIASCKVENDNTMDCVESDCVTSCQHLGFASGVCQEDNCICDQSTDEHQWDAGSDADADTDTDTDSDTDTDTDTDTDPDAGPDSGA